MVCVNSDFARLLIKMSKILKKQQDIAVLLVEMGNISFIRLVLRKVSESYYRVQQLGVRGCLKIEIRFAFTLFRIPIH